MSSIAAPNLWLDVTGAGETRWEDCRPVRTDLPRRLPEMPLLGITPLGPDDHTPTANGFRYRRTPRAGQGRLTGRPTAGLLVVLISPKHSWGAQDLRDWADFVHISHIAAVAVPGFTMITPYEVDGDGPRFMHLYEMDGDDPEASFQAMPALVRNRLGDKGFDDWAWHPELLIDYVSTYRRIDGPAVQT